MEDKLYKETINLIPEFLGLQLELKNLSDIFKPLKTLLTFNSGYIFFLNSESIILKYSDVENISLNCGKSFDINNGLMQTLIEEKPEVLSDKSQLISNLGLVGKSFLLLKLVMQKSVFGFVLLCCERDGAYNNINTEILRAVSYMLSYKIKDAELSDIFKNQLKTLKEGFVDTKTYSMTVEEENVKILESDKLKNEFLANVSHELRTPLNAIIGFSEILATMKPGELNEMQLDFIQNINVSGIHLLGMINEILDISKIEANSMKINKTKFEVSRALDEVVNVIKPLAIKKDIDLIKKLERDSEVFVDFQKLKQIMYNLLSNAIKFTGSGGTVEISIIFKRNKLILTVSDTGIGIAKDDIDKIFEKFIQLENAYTKTESSTGLGLTITKNFVEMHGGKIKVSSRVNKGTTFTVELPC